MEKRPLIFKLFKTSVPKLFRSALVHVLIASRVIADSPRRYAPPLSDLSKIKEGEFSVCFVFAQNKAQKLSSTNPLFCVSKREGGTQCRVSPHTIASAKANSSRVRTLFFASAKEKVARSAG